MSRFGILAFVFACMAGLVPAASRAALDFSSPADAASDLEIVVVEAPGCIYCHLFRRDVWPFYENSQRAKKVPLRFADLNSETSLKDLDLAGPIDNVPTALLLRKNKELGRIPGFVGPESFFQCIDRILASAP